MNEQGRSRMKKIDKLEKEVWRLRDIAVDMCLKFRQEGEPRLSCGAESMIVAYDCVLHTIKDIRQGKEGVNE